jgi:hypothetical protein
MAIEFICPNGHRLSTKDEDSGKLAKCPKCGAVTKVPGLNGSASGSTAEPIAAASASGKGLLERAAVGGDVSSAKSGPRLGGSKLTPAGGMTTNASGQAAAESGKTTSVVPGTPREESIVFLCPNGHKLNAPRRMQGRGGQCPHCGAKFIIPNLEEATLGDEGSTIETLDGLSGTSGLGSLTAPAGGQGSAEAAPAPAPGRSASGQPDDYQPWAPPPEEPQQHPLAALVMRLWSEREHGGVIELHLAGGAILVPDWFDRKLSHGPNGLFAAQAADGTVTMTIIPWETITRVVVRGVVGLPDGMFE